MQKLYSQEEFWKLYKNLPQEIQDALFSEETGNCLSDICQRNQAEDKLGDVVDLTGMVLLGILPLTEFEEALEKEAKLEPAIAKKINQEIFRFIFFPIKNLLEELYRTEIEPPAKPIVSDKKIEEEKIYSSPERNFEEKIPEEKKPEGDIYREPIE